VHGAPKRLPVDESPPVEPLDPYGASKHHVEHYLEIYSRSFSIRYTTLRYPNVYGPRQDPHGEAGVVAIFTQKMLLGAEPVINGSGEQQRDFVHVRDVAHASICALDRGDDLTVNIGSGIGTSVNDIFGALALAANYPRPAQYGPAKAGEVSSTYLDASLARQHLGWRPSVPLSEGLADTVKYFRARTAEESAVATG
jgi:UDP-glucose 4-epimerase